MSNQDDISSSLGDTSVSEQLESHTQSEIQYKLEKQKSAQLEEGIPTAEMRIDRINRCIALLVDNQERIQIALNEDFGSRAREETLFVEVLGSLNALKYARSHVRRWMRRRRRHSMFPLGLFGGRSWVEYQPLGIVGMLSPWNFPINLSFSPAASVFASGNRLMLKLSEVTPRCSNLISYLVSKYFKEEEFTVIIGGKEIGEFFTKQPFDHLMFTGGTATASHILHSAADNLVPVTLELGGKSPVIVSETANLDKAAQRIMAGKLLNAGQVCLSPDYVLVQESCMEALTEKLKASARQMFPKVMDNPDYTAIINEEHFKRIQELISDAREKGAQIIQIHADGEDLSNHAQRKIPPTLVFNPNDDMRVMQDEIFGPLLPIRSYSKIDEALAYINDRPHPLGLYFFGASKEQIKQVIAQTHSGGVTINDVVMHVLQDDLPFGGVNHSGMGAYHGEEGFRNFSHARSVYHQSPLEKVAGMFRPPYKRRELQRMLSFLIKK
ncbi:MAG: coniferyl aldehyde dehydrogenase [Candidatus Eutrophobiaceae bacterium]